MLAFPGLLVGPAKAAGIKVPPDPETYPKEEFPHWHAYVVMQVGAPMPFPGAHWENAKVVAALSDAEAKTITQKELLERGFSIGLS